MGKILGICFPEFPASITYNYNNPSWRVIKTSYPNVILVLPPGDNVEYIHINDELQNINDDDVDYYFVSYFTDCEEFKKWAQTVSKHKIVVGGYYPSENWQNEEMMQDLARYAGKIVIGNCTDIMATVKQEGTFVDGIVNYTTYPRFELFDPKKVKDPLNKLVFSPSITTSSGCINNCDFCEGTLMDKGRIRQAPLSYVRGQMDIIKQLYPGIIKHMVLSDSNFLQNKDWEDRLLILLESVEHISFCASINTINEEKINVLSKYAERITLIIGIETLTRYYPKSKNLDSVCKMLHDANILFNSCFIIDPIDVLEHGEQYIYELNKMFAS
jgi:radical SAM superfamily enzyme YgiQ (UPF0313 family)